MSEPGHWRHIACRGHYLVKIPVTASFEYVLDNAHWQTIYTGSHCLSRLLHLDNVWSVSVRRCSVMGHSAASPSRLLFPEDHRPSSRSRTTVERTVAWGSEGRRRSQKSSGKGCFPRLTRPVSSRSCRCSGRDTGLGGSKRATGRPHSVMITSSPALTWRKYALSDALSLDMVVVCITISIGNVFWSG